MIKARIGGSVVPLRLFIQLQVVSSSLWPGLCSTGSQLSPTLCCPHQLVLSINLFLNNFFFNLNPWGGGVSFNCLVERVRQHRLCQHKTRAQEQDLHAHRERAPVPDQMQLLSAMRKQESGRAGERSALTGKPQSNHKPGRAHPPSTPPLMSARSPTGRCARSRPSASPAPAQRG